MTKRFIHMAALLFITLFLVPAITRGQSVPMPKTPYLNLYLPPHGYSGNPSWDTLFNANFLALDTYLATNSGLWTVPTGGGVSNAGPVKMGTTNPVIFPATGGSYGSGYVLTDANGNGNITEAPPLAYVYPGWSTGGGGILIGAPFAGSLPANSFGIDSYGDFNFSAGFDAGSASTIKDSLSIITGSPGVAGTLYFEGGVTPTSTFDAIWYDIYGLLNASGGLSLTGNGGAAAIIKMSGGTAPSSP